jgi:hypothetical protein
MEWQIKHRDATSDEYLEVDEDAELLYRYCRLSPNIPYIQTCIRHWWMYAQHANKIAYKQLF